MSIDAGYLSKERQKPYTYLVREIVHFGYDFLEDAWFAIDKKSGRTQPSRYNSPIPMQSMVRLQEHFRIQLICTTSKQAQLVGMLCTYRAYVSSGNRERVRAKVDTTRRVRIVLTY